MIVCKTIECNSCTLFRLPPTHVCKSIPEKFKSSNQLMETLLCIFAISKGITLKQTPVCFSNFVFVKEENFTGCQECREFELLGLSIQYLYFCYANIDNLLWDTTCYEDAQVKTCYSRLGNPAIISHKVSYSPSYVSCPEKEMHYISTR